MSLPALAETPEPSEIGRRIREERERQGWTQRDLARRCGTSQAHICRLERGLRQVRIPTLCRVAEALGVHVMFFFTDPRLRGIYRTPPDEATVRAVETCWILAARTWVEAGETGYVLERLAEVVDEDFPAEAFAEAYPRITAWLREHVGVG